MAKKKKDARELNSEEEKELREGQAIYEITKTPGWKFIKKRLEDRAYHSWMDPRAANSQEEWMWRELNLFHSADVAKELLEWIDEIINRADYLEKVKNGLIDERRMKL
jgi:hypothetical protein